MATREALDVWLQDRVPSVLVGRLLDVGEGPYFEYDAAFRETKIELSPLKLPLRDGAFPPGPRALHRLPGLFADSVPDGWGLKVLHQVLRDSGVDPFRASPLSLLRAVGRRGMGALSYQPAQDIWGRVDEGLDLESLAATASRLDADMIDELPLAMRRVAGTSGGVRPKLTVAWHDDGRIQDAALPLAEGFRHVLIKFRSHTDSAALPRIEAAYLSMAAAAGLTVPAHTVRRLHSGEDALIVDRFDREGDDPRHVQTFAALLELDPANDLADYGHLLEVARRLTGSYAEVMRCLRLAAFNVYAGNRDDHTRNVAFRRLPLGKWELAPAYDLTWTERGTGFHAMSVDGESRAPGTSELQRLGVNAGLDAGPVDLLLAEVRAAVARWPEFASAAEVPAPWVSRIQKSLSSVALPTSILG
jgi:serine/threonine-protein kinase HipA